MTAASTSGVDRGALQRLCAAALARPATQAALEYEGRWHSWGELAQLAGRLGALLDASNCAADARIAFAPRNRPSAIAALLALLARGRDLQMIYAFQSPAAIARDLASLRPAVLVAAAEDFSEALCATLREHGIVGIALAAMDAHAVAGLAQARPASPHDAPAVAREPGIEILTSGTTGPPKRFQISYELIVRHHIGAITDLSQQPPALLCFPLGNITGVYSTIPPLVKGQRVVILDRFSISGWHDYVKRYRPTASGMPPAGVQMLLDANIAREDLASLRGLGTGAAPLDPSVHRAFEARYGIPILLSYGATEFAGPVTAMTVDLHAQWGERKFGSVGRALPGAQLRVIDADSGAVLPPGTEGILEAISPRIGPEWIRTADIALIDEDGFVFHRGRADGAIMRGGFKLLPETIERALQLHPSVSAAAVTALADRRLGEVPGAAVQFRPEATASAAQLEAHLREHLPATHIPAHWRFVAALPRTPSFKVDRPALRALFADR